MRNKRTMVITTVAILAVILSVAGFLAYTRSNENAQPIPVTGGSQSNQLASQNQAANSSVFKQFESAEQIDAQQGEQALKDQAAPAANSSVTNQFESAEQIQAEQGLQAVKDKQSQGGQ